MGFQRLDSELIELPRFYGAPIRIGECKVSRNIWLPTIEPTPNRGSVVGGGRSDTAFQAAVVPDCPGSGFLKRLVNLEVCPDCGDPESGKD